jgi:hypothetical protein
MGERPNTDMIRQSRTSKVVDKISQGRPKSWTKSVAAAAITYVALSSNFDEVAYSIRISWGVNTVKRAFPLTIVAAAAATGSVWPTHHASCEVMGKSARTYIVRPKHFTGVANQPYSDRPTRGIAWMRAKQVPPRLGSGAINPTCS